MFPTENNPYNSNWDPVQSNTGSFKYGLFECFKSDMPCECFCVASICLFGHYNCLFRNCILNWQVAQEISIVTCINFYLIILTRIFTNKEKSCACGLLCCFCPCSMYFVRKQLRETKNVKVNLKQNLNNFLIANNL